MARYFHEILAQSDVELPSKSINQKILLKRLLEEGIRLVDCVHNNKDVNTTKNIQEEICDIVADVAAALTNREIQLLDELPRGYPNGIKVGTHHSIKENKLYDGLPPMITSQQFDKGMVINYDFE